MNSLEFIKQHVKEWPNDEARYVTLNENGTIMFHKSTVLPPNHIIITNVEDHYTGKVWTREEFEACGKSTGIDATVEERGNRYGAFKDGADIMQELKSVMRSTRNWSNLTPSQREALEMIQHKVGRILNGDPNYIENFTDIAGYAILVKNEMLHTDGATDAKITYVERVDGSWIEVSKRTS